MTEINDNIFSWNYRLLQYYVNTVLYHEYKMVFDIIAQTNLYSKDTIYRKKEFTVNFR